MGAGPANQLVAAQLNKRALLAARSLDLLALGFVLHIEILPARIEAHALLRRDDGVYTNSTNGSDRVERRLDWLDDHVELTIEFVEHRIHSGALGREEAEVVVHRFAVRGQGGVIAAKSALGREANHTAHEDGSEKKRECLLFGSLHVSA